MYMLEKVKLYCIKYGVSRVTSSGFLTQSSSEASHQVLPPIFCSTFI